MQGYRLASEQKRHSRRHTVLLLIPGWTGLSRQCGLQKREGCNTRRTQSRHHSSHSFLSPRVEGRLRWARECGYWQEMNETIKTFISKCDVCKSVDPKQLRETRSARDMTHQLWARVGTDLFSFQNKDYVKTVDYYIVLIELSGGLFTRHKEQHSCTKMGGPFCPPGDSRCRLW